MYINSECINLLEKALGVDREAYSLKGNNEILEVVSENGNIEEYYLGNFINDVNNKNDFTSYNEKFEKYIQENNIEVRPMMIFESWEQEQQFLDSELEKVDAKGKREIKNLFSSARLVYIDSEELISMELEEEGINYLEYKIANNKDKERVGLIFNLSLKELYRLYNRTGVSLFKDNVRIGISGSKSALLRTNFTKNFLLGLYNLNTSNTGNEKIKQEIVEYLKIINGSGDFEGYQNAIENFWFHHNGITIYSEDSFCIVEDKISFNPFRVSVINGAQTLTHCFSIIREIRNDLSKTVRIKAEGEKNEIDISGSEIIIAFETLLDKMMNNIKIKTIFIKAGSEMKRSITLGLNTQIPVNIEDIITNTEIVDEINKILAKNNIRICRLGEDTFHGGIYLLDFVKSYLVFRDNPGEARNLQKNNLEYHLKEIKTSLQNKKVNLGDLLKAIDTFEYIDKWWRKRSKPENINEIDYKGLASNGKYYFKAYCNNMYDDTENIEDMDGYLQELYKNFINTFLKIQTNIDSNELKKNELFSKFLRQHKNFISNFQKDGDFTLDIDNFMYNLIFEYEEYEKSNRSKSNRSMFIKSKLEKEKISVVFRTIKLVEKLNNEYKLSEHFPFPSQTFSQLYEINDYPNVYDKSKFISFEESNFSKEINKEFFLFVFSHDSSGNLKKIDLFPNFSFSKLSIDAKEVYNRTVRAFQKGNTDLFVKSSEGLKFHVRPKARSEKDIFTFTDGSEQIKRTFWVNKDTLEELLKTYEYGSYRSKKVFENVQKEHMFIKSEGN